MDSKFFDIPFRPFSGDSDFICKDGEISEATNVTFLSDSGEIANPANDFVIPPIPDIDFALRRTVLPGWHIHPDVYPSQTIPASDPSMEYWTKMAASLLVQFKSEAELQNLFISPFYVAAAWRMADNTYISPSSPVLITPNSKVPLVGTTGDLASSQPEFKIAGAVGELIFKMRAPEILRDWVGKIMALEIFTSQPLHSYDTFYSFLPGLNMSTDSWCECLDESKGTIKRERICTDTFPVGWKAVVKGSLNLDNLTDFSETKFFPFASVPFRDIDIADEWTSTAEKNAIVIPEKGLYPGLKFGDIASPKAEKPKSHTLTLQGIDKDVTVKTRVIKLSGAASLKRVMHVALRGNYTPSAITITIYGSRDMIRWWTVAKRKGGTMVSLPRSPFRFYQVEISGLLRSGENLQGLSFTCVPL